jgi:hypothetical protein
MSASIAPPDAYSDLLRDTRTLRREHALLRDAWFGKLPVERKDEVLFELEILLKGLACFANPRNHPGPARRPPVVAQDFREHLSLVREGLGRVAALARQLLVEGDRAFVFQRYLETVMPDDNARTRLVRDISQDTPEGSLFVLRHAMSNLVEVTNGLTRLNRVPYRLFYSLLTVAQREVSQSSFFNPLSALEFRPEFDRITNPQMLELMQRVPSEQGRRLVALTFLSLFRMLRYVSLMESTVRAPGKRSTGVVYLTLSVLRSDARALTGYLRQRAGGLLAESYERDLFKVPASLLEKRYDALLAEGHALLDVKATLGTIAANVRLELRRVFEHDFPPPDSHPDSEDLRDGVGRVTSNLRPALQNAILFLAKSLGSTLDARGVFDDAAARRAVSERLRRDVWMFAQIVRAFAHKARAVRSGEDGWSGVSPLQFVREFLSYFRAMGYPLLRTADYPRFDAFMSALSEIEESDLLDGERLATAIDEAEQFHDFLQELFEGICRRDELSGVAFDRRAAAGALKLYLGD